MTARETTNRPGLARAGIVALAIGFPFRFAILGRMSYVIAWFGSVLDRSVRDVLCHLHGFG